MLNLCIFKAEVVHLFNALYYILNCFEIEVLHKYLPVQVILKTQINVTIIVTFVNRYNCKKHIIMPLAVVCNCGAKGLINIKQQRYLILSSEKLHKLTTAVMIVILI